MSHKDQNKSNLEKAVDLMDNSGFGGSSRNQLYTRSQAWVYLIVLIALGALAYWFVHTKLAAFM